MAITFAVRGDSLNARYSTAGKVPGLLSQTGGTLPNVVASALTGMIGSHYIDMYNGGAARQALIYPGGNKWTGQAFSVLFRAALQTGGDFAMWTVVGSSAEGVGQVGIMYPVSSVYVCTMRNDIQADIFTQSDTSATASTGVFHDWVLTCTGTTASNGLEVWKDGTRVYQGTLSANAPANKSPALTNIAIGYMQNRFNTAFFLEEFVIWDSVINPASVALTSGTGSLNGASRTAFVDVAAFDGMSNSAPAITDVRAATAYTVGGTAYTGTLDLPAVGDVKLGVDYDNATKTGTYAPSAGGGVTKVILL